MRLRGAILGLRTWVEHHRKLLLGVLATAGLLSVAIQLVYPYGRALPLAHVAGQSVGLQARADIILAIQDSFAEASVKLRAGAVEQTDRLADLGAQLRVDDMAAHAINYPLLHRLIPLSLLWYQPNLDRYLLEFDDERLETASAMYAEKLSFEPVDAGIEIDGDDIEVTEAKAGQAVAIDQLRQKITATSYSWGETVVDVDRSTLQPAVSNASVADIRQQARRVLEQDITVSVVGQADFAPDRETIASWLSLSKEEDGSPVLTGDQEALRAYAEEIASATTQPPTATVVVTRDGRELSRKTGQNGLGISVVELVKSLDGLIEAPRDTPTVVTIERQTIKPPLEYRRSYTSSQDGLQAYVSDATAAGNIHIAVQQLAAGHWSAEGRANESIPSASTYKPLLMLRVFEDITSQKLRWSSKVGGETVQQCFERMIVLSANQCAEALIERYGVSELTSYLHSRGFSKGTGFTFSEATQTTAADLANFLVRLQEGDLLSRSNREMMLEKMGRQIFRQGIPAGTKAPAYGKVGFLWDYLHDMEIVRHPEGSYVLVVMTKGLSWSKIASITSDIEAILYGDGIQAG